MIFHRNKDLTLIRMLRMRDFPGTAHTGEVMVVIPFCNGDGRMFFKNIEWWRDLNDGQRHEFDALLSYENNTNQQVVHQITALAKTLFRNVYTTSYPHGQPGEWMQTIAFRHAATQVQLRFNQPFIWIEYNMIPLKRGWLDALVNAYRVCGKPFAGPIVPNMGHMNGTGIYPADTPSRIPRGINATRTAWDVAMKPEMIQHCHDLSALMYHCWGVNGGRLHPYHGTAPSFWHNDLINQIPPSAMTFHRCKDGSLIDRLRERKVQHG